MINLYRETDNSGQLPQLLTRLDETGGSIVMYLQVYSFVFATISRTVFEHVPSGRSTVFAGLRHSFIALLFGPWSWIGPFLTLQALMTNISGGVDVTHLAGAETDGANFPFEEVQTDAQRKLKALEYGYVAVLFIILGVIIWKVVLPVFDPSIWPLDFVLPILALFILAALLAVMSIRDK